jgi:hypothetical protein
LSPPKQRPPENFQTIVSKTIKLPAGLIRQTERENSKWQKRPIVIHEHQFQRLKSVLGAVCVECAARVVFLVDRDGQPIAFHGDIGDMDTTSFSSLAAGNVAATTSMAKLIGEDVFPAVVHEGERESIFISVIGRSLAGRRFRRTLDARFGQTANQTREPRSRRHFRRESRAIRQTQRRRQNSFFAEITDEDIDSLFS